MCVCFLCVSMHLELETRNMNIRAKKKFISFTKESAPPADGNLCAHFPISRTNLASKKQGTYYSEARNNKKERKKEKKATNNRVFKRGDSLGSERARVH